MGSFKIKSIGDNINIENSGETTLNEKPILAIPVGFVCCLTCETSPASLFGGTWEQISQGRALFGAGTLNGITYSAGSTKNAGLPNISGSFGANWTAFTSNVINGAFSTSNNLNKNRGSGSETSYTRQYEFNASKSNSIYGNSTTVQPNAYVCYVWRKIG